MKKNNKSNGLSPLQLALIITGSIVAALAIVLVVVKIVKKKKAKAAIEGCCDCDCGEEWFEGDEDFLGELRCDDEDCCCCESEDDIAAAVDEAIEAAVEE